MARSGSTKRIRSGGDGTSGMVYRTSQDQAREQGQQHRQAYNAGSAPLPHPTWRVWLSMPGLRDEPCGLGFRFRHIALAHIAVVLQTPFPAIRVARQVGSRRRIHDKVVAIGEDLDSETGHSLARSLEQPVDLDRLRW